MPNRKHAVLQQRATALLQAALDPGANDPVTQNLPATNGYLFWKSRQFEARHFPEQHLKLTARWGIRPSQFLCDLLQTINRIVPRSA